ncbi:MAG TPA: protein kinase [Pirellulales bacterium]|nr:protein kinase [Pirellulales bacterium]
MALSIQEFWQLVVASGLHDEENCRRLADGFSKARESGAIERTVSLPEWMLQTGEMSRYQARILLAGKPGPFAYGDYLVVDRLEIPGLSGLFRAVHRPTKIKVTLSFLSGALAGPAVLEQLTREAATAAMISRHKCGPYLTHCHGLVDLGAFKFLVVEELPSATLADRLAGGKKLPPKEAARIGCQVLLGLIAFGEAHVGHGAVRPGRIWLAPDGTARLATFPLVRDPLAIIGAQATIELEDAAVNYCAPECINGEAANYNSDLYSLGCVFYEMLSGRVPFPSGDRQRRLEQHRTATPQPLDETNPAIPKKLSQLIAILLSKKTDERGKAMPFLLKEFGAGANSGRVPPARAELDTWLAEHGEVPASPPSDAAVVPMLFNPHESTLAPGPGRQKRSQRSRLPMIAGIAAALLLVAGGVAFYLNSGTRAPQRITPLPMGVPPAAETAGAPSGEGTPAEGESPAHVAEATATDTAHIAVEKSGAEPSASGGAGELITALDGTMWASPTHGAPLDLKYLAPGAEVIIALRPAQFASRTETEKLLDPRTLGLLGEFVAQQLPALAAAPLAEIDAAVIGVLDSATGAPRLSLVITRHEPATADELLKAWGNPAAQEKDGVTFYREKDRAFWLPGEADAAGKTLVIGPADLIVEEVIPAGDAAPALSRDLEELLATSDRDRDLTILASPGILQTASGEWFPGNTSRLRGALDWFLSGHESDVTAGERPAESSSQDPAAGARSMDMSSHGLPQSVLASAHLSEADLFLELRASVAANQSATNLARAFGDRVSRLPKRTSEYIRALDLSDYSRDVLFGYPLMIEQLGKHTVVGTAGRQVVLRAYLPSVAAHNLALGVNLALAERLRSGGASAPRQATTAKPSTSEPLAQRLDRKMSLVFDRATLEKALQTVGEEIGTEVVILGADLQLEGITKNQSFGLQERDQTAREILQKIMRRANPDGKLIYVIRGGGAGNGETLVITTRASARQRGEAVPAELAEQP